MTNDTMRNRPRTNTLPQNTHYRDTGCDLQPHCLTCTLPKCRYDYGPAHTTYYRVTKALRDAEVRRRYREGVSPAVIAGRLNLSRRTIRRIIREGVE